MVIKIIMCTCSNVPISSFVCDAKLRTARIILAGVEKRNKPGNWPFLLGGTTAISSAAGTFPFTLSILSWSPMWFSMSFGTRPTSNPSNRTSRLPIGVGTVSGHTPSEYNTFDISWVDKDVQVTYVCKGSEPLYNIHSKHIQIYTCTHNTYINTQIEIDRQIDMHARASTHTQTWALAERWFNSPHGAPSGVCTGHKNPTHKQAQHIHITSIVRHTTYPRPLVTASSLW